MHFTQWNDLSCCLVENLLLLFRIGGLNGVNSVKQIVGGSSTSLL